jgi:uridine kinase
MPDAPKVAASAPETVAALLDPTAFSVALYEKMCLVTPAAAELEPYEFRYALHNLLPADGWGSVEPAPSDEIERMVNSSAFYSGVQIKPRLEGRIVLDATIVRLAHMLFVGLVQGLYPVEWVRKHFFFDVRGFFFLHRTTYFTDRVVEHFGGKPLLQFEQKQVQFERDQAVGYRAFRQANAEVDAAFSDSLRKLIAARGTPVLIAIAGPTAAGKTEIVERLRATFELEGKPVTAIEMDNFLTDRDPREEAGINSLGKGAIHFDLFRETLNRICSGQKALMPRYDFVFATSSHDSSGRLKPNCAPIEIEPADVVFLEGNFPFLLNEVAHLVGIKVVYLTNDDVRLKRKWKRDIDYRKKYEPTYFRNRFFRDQFLVAQRYYLPQLELCDLAVDTTGAALWATPAIARDLRS